MKEKLSKILCISLFSIGSGVMGQNKLKVSLDAGYTYSILKSDLSNLIDSRYRGRYGFGVNLSGEYMIWKSLFVSTGISFQQKNYKFERTGNRDGWYTNYHNDFLSFPLLIGGYILNNPHESEGVWIKVAGGMYTDYWLSMKREGRYPVFNELQEDGTFNYTEVSDTYDFKENENQINRLGYGLTGQAQLGYSLKNFDIYGSYNYQYGLSDINKENAKNHKSTLQSYMISLGVSYKFK
ncbi:outer membrane beta-barrel protein [Chryseobacterium sp.]|uniref:outer membrane beta-barrel protein n=1 Tax=Chryseobacterium sp. TaxID=1871047 RepID=UPI0025BB02A4|nr:outer membrane beta-barrel protein [Chryseobacterium sp.]